MDNNRYQDEKDLPMNLNEEDLSRVLGVSMETAHAIMFSEGFPSKRFGEEAFIQRSAFLRWMESGDIYSQEEDRYNPFKDSDTLPLTMDAKDVSRLLNISVPAVYRIMRTTDFPTIKLGRRRLVNREKLIEWLSNQEDPVV